MQNTNEASRVRPLPQTPQGSQQPSSHPPSSGHLDCASQSMASSTELQALSCSQPEKPQKSCKRPRAAAQSHVCCPCVAGFPASFNQGRLDYASKDMNSIEFKKTIQQIVTNTTDPDKLGQGKDVKTRWYKDVPDHLKVIPCRYNGFKVISVERIQNPKLWRKYTTSKEDIVETEYQLEFKTAIEPPLDPSLQAEINEGYLYHACSNYAVLQKIRSNGFDEKYNTAGMFGEGCYFAEDMTKADQYIDPKQDYIHVILARVCMGNPWITTEACSKRKFPEGYPDECQSTLAEMRTPEGKVVRRFREFIVPKGNLSYPEYILTLKRLPRPGYQPPPELTPQQPLKPVTEVIPTETNTTEENENGHILRLPLNRLKNLNMTQSQIARALNKKPEVTVFLSEEGDTVVLQIRKLFPDAILVEHNEQLEKYEQTSSKIEAQIQLGDKMVDANMEVGSVETVTVDHSQGVPVPFTPQQLNVLQNIEDGFTDEQPDENFAWVAKTIVEDKLSESLIAEEKKTREVADAKAAEERRQENARKRALEAEAAAQRKADIENQRAITLLAKGKANSATRDQKKSDKAGPEPKPVVDKEIIEEPVERTPEEERARLLELGKVQFQEGIRILCTGNFNGSLAQFEKSDSNGYPPASIMLCRIYAGDFGSFKKDLNKLEDYFKKARIAITFVQEEAKHPPSQPQAYFLTACWVWNELEEKQRSHMPIDIVQNLRLAADAGLPLAQLKFAECLASGQGITKDPARAVYYYRTATGLGCAQAQFALGTCYKNGFGVGIDLPMAVGFYRLAAYQRFALGQFSLAQCYADGLGVTKDQSEALHYCRLAAAQGHAGAQLGLAMRYHEGTGVEKNSLMSQKYFKLAIDHFKTSSDPVDKFNLGLCYEHGSGIQQDLNKAYQCYADAALAGYSDAKSRLGYCFEKGIGVRKDVKMAATYYQISADEGFVEAQFKFGLCCLKGLGTKQDKTLALKYLKDAADRGNKEAQLQLSEIDEK